MAINTMMGGRMTVDATDACIRGIPVMPRKMQA